MTDRHHVQSLLDLRRWAESLDRVGPLLAEDPDDVHLLGLRAQALLGLERPDEALRDGNRMVAVAPEDEWGHRICSVALGDLGLHEEATAAAATSVRLAPSQWRTHARYAGAAAALPHRMRDAEAAAGRAVQLAPHGADVHVLAAQIASVQRRDDDARAGFRRALALEPSHPDAMTGLARLGSQRRLADRARDYASVLSDTPDHERARESIELLALRFVRRVYWASLVGLFAGLVVSAGTGAPGRVTGTTVAVGIVLLVGTTAYTASLLRAIPRGVSRYVRGRVRSDPMLLATTILTVGMFLTALVTCFVPRGGAVGVSLLRPLGLLNIAIVVWGAVRARAS